MSNLLSTQAMVAECQRRVPIQLPDAFWMRKLNEAYRWISQKGNFVWDVKYAIGPNVNANQFSFLLPADCDPGKPMWLSGPQTVIGGGTVGVMKSIIPYKQWDESLEQQFAEVVAPPGMYSCWSYITEFTPNVNPAYTPTYRYIALLYPQSAAPTTPMVGFTFFLAYHVDTSGTEYTNASTQFFPTPNSFDNLMIELAEAEVRRIYGLSGWDIIQKRAESSIVTLLDSYRSTKNVLAGMVDQQKQTNETKLMAQERS